MRGNRMGHLPSPAVPAAVFAPGRRRWAGERRRATCLGGVRAVAGRCGAGGAPRCHRGEKLSVEVASVAWRVLLHARAVQVVSGSPGLVPRFERGVFGTFGEPARAARPGPTAPDTVAIDVGCHMPAHHVLRVTPEQTVDDVFRLVWKPV